MQLEKIIEIAQKIANEEAEKLNLKVLDVEYVKENGIKILRVVAEGEESLTLDESSDLNEAISNRIDLIPEGDFIEEQYYLEVCSAGLEKPLKTDSDILGAVGMYVCVKTYEKLDGIKEFYGDLVSFDGSVVTISYLVKTQRKQIQIQKEKISKIRLAVRF